MAVNFIARKCACGGKLEFDPLKKIWICKYCGTVVEREATFDKIHVDGLESINDVVRQTLMDVANQKMDSAYRNLEDCERKDHMHVGTLIAHISYHLENISVAKSPDEARASLDKVKIYAKRLQEEYPAIAEDEINLYEAFGENLSDVYANLLVVFDTLGDSGRFEYISCKLRPEEVFSPYANKALLRISIKHNKLDVVEVITKNINHIDRKSSLQEIMDHYPDNGKKVELIKRLFDAKLAEKLSKKYFEGYFINSSDSVETKSAVISLLNTTDIHCSADVVIKAMSAQMDSYDRAKFVFDTVYDAEINDQETEALLVFCIMINKTYEIQAAFFDALIGKKVFVALNGRSVISFLDSSTLPTDKRVDILQKMLCFQIDHKGLDVVYNYYLNNNMDDQEVRSKIIDVLLAEGSPISTNTVKTYVVKTQTDGDAKKDVIAKIFATGINKTYLGDLLSEYLLHTTDSKELQKNISDYLITLGFKVDSGVFSQYVISNEDASLKLVKLKQLISNGTMVKADTLDQYILHLNSPADFSGEILNLLTQNSYAVGFQAYAKFVLFCKDIDKAGHHEKLLRTLNCDIARQRVTLCHCGNNLSCNIAQAYILNTTEGYDLSNMILQQMLSVGIKLNTDISVNGGSIKFKKYVGEHKNELSQLSLQLCTEHKMFSFF